MNKLVKINHSVLIAFTLFCLCSCSYGKNYIGMNKGEVIESLEKFPRLEVNGRRKIVLCVNSSFRYFDSIDDIKKNRVIMESNQWEIAFEKTFLGKRYILLIFDKNMVISQQKKVLNDGP